MLVLRVPTLSTIQTTSQDRQTFYFPIFILFFPVMIGSPRIAKNPMLPRLADLHKEISLTALYGADSWISAITREEFMAIRGVTESDHVITNVEMIENTGHHVYANAQLFNYQVNRACQSSDTIL